MLGHRVELSALAAEAADVRERMRDVVERDLVRLRVLEVDLELPRNQGPQGIPGARYTDIGFGLRGSVTDPVTIPVTRETAIIDGSLAEATGTGSIAIDLDGVPVGSVSFAT